MIHAADTDDRRRMFSKAIVGKPYFQSLMARDLALWADNPGAPTKLFVLPDAALSVGGTVAQLCGHPRDWEELREFLRFVGVRCLTVSEQPSGDDWILRRTLFIREVPAGGRLPLAQPPAGLAEDREPRVREIAEELFPDRPERADHFYSETCAALSRGMVRLTALRDGDGRMVSTVGAYAMANGEAYLAMGETVQQLRGRGIGGWLIAGLTNELAAEGWRVVLLCEEQRRRFYDRLGFAETGCYWQYEV